MTYQMHTIKERNEYSINQEQSWKVDYGYKGYGFAVKRDDNSTVCNFPDGLRPEQKALAQMISATPDLLAALRDLLEEADLNEVDEYTVSKIEAARAAIAKATGGHHD
jgi:hypothetical protein